MGGVPRRILPDDPMLGAVLERWRRVYGAPDATLCERLADGRSVLFATRVGERVVAFVHFRDHKGILRHGPARGDDIARLLADSPDFGVYTFEQLYFCGGEWTLETGAGPVFRAMAEHLRATTLRWALVAHLHSDRAFFAETAAFLEGLGFRRRPGDYVTYRLDLPTLSTRGGPPGRTSAGIPAGTGAPADGCIPPSEPEPPPSGPCPWRFLGDDPPPAAEDLVRVYAAVFPGDPPADELRRDLEAGRWGPLSGAAYDGTGVPVAVVLARPAPPDALQIDRLGTVPGRRGGGVVTGAFFDYVLRCRAAGVGALVFQVRATNEAATGLVAERLGARRVKEERFYVLSGTAAREG